MRALHRALAFARLRLGARRLRLAAELCFFLAALSTSLPLFAARYVPVQDLPQHAAAVRVLFDYADPDLGFQRCFVRDFFATQYLSVYLLAGVFSIAVDAVVACKLVLALSLAALPYSLRALLAELHKPRSLALLALPLALNVHFLLGFMNFLAGLPLLFAGLALAMRAARSPARAPAVALGAVALVCFYTHVIPFGLLVLGVLFVVLASRSLATARRVLVPLVPSALAAIAWLFTNPAGALVATMAQSDAGPRLELTPFDRALDELPRWLLDTLPGDTDDTVLLGSCALSAALLVAGSPRLRRLRRSLPVIALAGVAALGYFITPEGYGFIWPINARFPLIALLLVIPALPRPARVVRAAAALAALALSAILTHATFAAFRDAAREEAAGLADIAARVPLGSRVAGLVWSRHSRFVHFSPYLHTAAWVQAERGGAAMFTFADFPHSPFRFRDGDRPPRVPPRWEWTPERVDPRADLTWYDYVVTRGGPGRISGWRIVSKSGAYALWVPRTE